jgi:hypothetical protein
VVVRAADADGAGAGRQATAFERAGFAAAVAAGEDAWRAEAEQTWAGDVWSQRDDFHARERNRIRDVATENGVPVEEVLRAVDHDLHRARARQTSPDLRGAGAVPCKPRPIYD